MYRYLFALLLVVVCCVCTSCGGGGGGGGGATSNANPGIYEGAYSRGGGSIVIDVASQGAIKVILTDESGGTYTGTVTESQTQGSFDFTGTLHNTQSPTQTLSLTASLIPGGSQVTINGQVSGAFSVSFAAN